MRGVTITRHGPPSVLEVRDYPDPTPSNGQVRIAVAATGLNFAEVSARQGLYPDAPPPPSVVGYEVAGTIDAVGEGVTDVKAGDRVLALTRFGGHASSVAVDRAFVTPLPSKMSFSEAAAIPVNYLTAHHMLFHIGTVHPGQSILLHMAAGGVGIAVLQLLRPIRDLTIFGTASASKHEMIRELGCTHPIDYHRENYVDVVRGKTDGRGVDIVLDPLGGAEWRRSWGLVAPGGRHVAFGFANAIAGSTRSWWRVLGQAARIPFITPLKAMDENKSLQGVNLGHLWGEHRLLKHQADRLMALYEEGVVRPHIHAEVPFDRAAEAHEMIEQRKNVGKVLLIP